MTGIILSYAERTQSLSRSGATKYSAPEADICPKDRTRRPNQRDSPLTRECVLVMTDRRMWKDMAEKQRGSDRKYLSHVEQIQSPSEAMLRGTVRRKRASAPRQKLRPNQRDSPLIRESVQLWEQQCETQCAGNKHLPQDRNYDRTRGIAH